MVSSSSWSPLPPLLLLLVLATAPSMALDAHCPNRSEPQYQLGLTQHPPAHRQSSALYDFARLFLQAVQPEDFPLEIVFQAARNESLTAEVMRFEAGYLACLALTVVYMVTMLTMGSVLLRRHLCRRDATLNGQPLPPLAPWYRQNVTVATGLSVVIVFLLPGVILTFVTNNRTHENVRPTLSYLRSDTGVIYEAVASVLQKVGAIVDKFSVFQMEIIDELSGRRAIRCQRCTAPPAGSAGDEGGVQEDYRLIRAELGKMQDRLRSLQVRCMQCCGIRNGTGLKTDADYDMLSVPVSGILSFSPPIGGPCQWRSAPWSSRGDVPQALYPFHLQDQLRMASVNLLHAVAGMTFVFSWLFIITVFVNLFFRGNAHALFCRSWTNGEIFKLLDTWRHLFSGPGGGAPDNKPLISTVEMYHGSIPDAAIHLDGLVSIRADRDNALSGKTRGGGVRIYINESWCKNSVFVVKYCSPVVEFAIVRCRPFYLLREFSSVFIITLYIPPSANTREALQELYGAISELQNVHPDGLFIVTGDFNHANLKSVLPKLHQHVNSATRGVNALDLVYTNISGAYRAEPRPHLGYSDHMSVMLIPAYRPIVRRSKPLLKQVRTWPAGAISALQDCFEQTTWITFKEAATVNLEEYTASVTGYLGKCIDDVTVSKTITTHPKQKPWMTAEVRMLLRTRDSAFRTGDRDALRKTRAKLSRAIREAKRAHAQRIHRHFKDAGDTRHMWEGIQAITNYRKTSPSCDSDAILPDALNDFYARFEAQNNVAAEKSIPPQNDQVLCLTAADVRHTLRGVNPRKAAGPDNIPGRVLRECAVQLADVLTDTFNISLSCTVVPTCFKTTTIVPVLKKPTVSCLNHYHPIALTSIIMKCFERLVMRHIKTHLPPSLDPLQFAYRPNRSTDDAISTTLHLALTHLEKKGTYVRMLFIDFSSAFNTIVPQHLIGKLSSHHQVR
ncbi:hypothetical protein P4O66_000144 [Electrophorus voltai]|uniref:Reverse transcriptase domain-containing protein n=1 Tax=Electrophorus voltai TaxID=2609070 RepID=A0AAD8ZVQ4_9TELE|nr:hypothetical protein P4O66_000144 [Electrophorus voltai]